MRNSLHSRSVTIYATTNTVKPLYIGYHHFWSLKCATLYKKNSNHLSLIRSVELDVSAFVQLEICPRSLKTSLERYRTIRSITTTMLLIKKAFMVH